LSLNSSINPIRTFLKIALAGWHGCQLVKPYKILGVIFQRTLRVLSRQTRQLPRDGKGM
jgi:hypothetical protein